MKTHLKIALLLGSLTGLGLLYYFLNPALSSFFPQCPFFRTTGYLCPGCGSQRAFHELLHGHWQTAIRHNLLLVLSIPFLLYFAWIQVQNRRQDYLSTGRRWLYSVGGLVLIFWLLRNIPAYPFSLLAP